MTVIRVQHRYQYTVLINSTLRDSRLSYRARGVLAYLLSYPDGASVDSAKIADGGSEGRDAIRSALKELEGHGYITRRNQQHDDGTWRRSCVVRETPGQNGDWESDSDLQPPGPGNPTPVDQAPKDFEVPNEMYKGFRGRDPGNPQTEGASRYPELKRPAREQRILDGEFGQQH